MKRSEMVDIIRDWVIDNMDDSYISEESASLFLKKIEECGMLPPTITILPHSYNRQEGKMGFDSNEWEPE